MWLFIGDSNCVVSKWLNRMLDKCSAAWDVSAIRKIVDKLHPCEKNYTISLILLDLIFVMYT